MRRIIERVVTVVTTTTWTISWQGDPLDHQSGLVVNDSPEPDNPSETAKHIRNFSSVISMKEDDSAETKTVTDSATDEPPNKS